MIDGLLATKLVQLQRTPVNTQPVEIKKPKPTVPQEVRFTNSAHQPIRSTRKRRARCSNKENQVRTEWICSMCKVPLCLSKTKSFPGLS